MGQTLDTCDNPFVQIFNEFYLFLYLCSFSYPEGDTRQNLWITCTALYMRALSDFFSDQPCSKNQDDSHYRRYLDENKYPKDNKDLSISLPQDLSISLPKNLRAFLNKNVFHISEKRGKMLFPQEEFSNQKNVLIETISHYIRALDNGYLKKEYDNSYQQEEVKKLKSLIFTLLYHISLYNGRRGIFLNL